MLNYFIQVIWNYIKDILYKIADNDLLIADKNEPCSPNAGRKLGYFFLSGTFLWALETHVLIRFLQSIF